MLLLILVILLAGNAVFVMAEMAMVSARRARLAARAEKGDVKAAAAVALMDRPNTFLSTVQIGITLIGILMGAFGEAAIAEQLEKRLSAVPQVAPYARGVSLAVTVLLLTYASLVFAELVPKRLARAAPETLSSWLAVPMTWISRFAAPAVWVLSASTELLVKLVPLRTPEQDNEAEEEVKALIATGAEQGVFHEGERDLVERVFKMGDQKIRALMVPRTDIDFLRADDTLQRVRVVLATTSHSHYPICETSLDDLVGVVHVKDLVRAGILSDTVDLRALARPPLFIPESTPAIKVLDQFRTSGKHIAFVVDEYGSMRGLITLNDLLEALVGEITPSESARPEPMVVRRADGSYLLDGMLGIGELKEIMDAAELPREGEAGFSTLGGFVMSHLGRIPSTGDYFEVAIDASKQVVAHGAEESGSAPSGGGEDAVKADDGSMRVVGFEIVDMDRTRVDKVLMRTITPTLGGGASGGGASGSSGDSSSGGSSGGSAGGSAAPPTA